MEDSEVEVLGKGVQYKKRYVLLSSSFRRFMRFSLHLPLSAFHQRGWTMYNIRKSKDSYKNQFTLFSE